MKEIDWEINYKTQNIIYKGNDKHSGVSVPELYRWMQKEMRREEKRERVKQMIETFKKL